jgi:hypothetical protein
MSDDHAPVDAALSGAVAFDRASIAIHALPRFVARRADGLTRESRLIRSPNAERRPSSGLREVEIL